MGFSAEKVPAPVLTGPMKIFQRCLEPRLSPKEVPMLGGVPREVPTQISALFLLLAPLPHNHSGMPVMSFRCLELPANTKFVSPAKGNHISTDMRFL